MANIALLAPCLAKDALSLPPALLHMVSRKYRPSSQRLYVLYLLSIFFSLVIGLRYASLGSWDLSSFPYPLSLALGPPLVPTLVWSLGDVVFPSLHYLNPLFTTLIPGRVLGALCTFHSPAYRYSGCLLPLSPMLSYCVSH